MTTDPKERILEASLEEVLASQSPPDLTARIMQALDAQRAESERNGSSTQQVPFARPVSGQAAGAPNAHVVEPPVQVTSADRSTKRRKSTWQNVLIAAGILGVGITIGLTVLKFADQQDKPIAGGSPPTNDLVKDDVPPKTDQPIDNHPPIGRDNLVKQDQSPKIDSRDEFPDLPKFVKSDSPTPKFKRPERVLPAPSEHNVVVALVNTHLKSQWEKAKVTVAEPVDDSQWCKRAYQRILGRDATNEEVDRFVKNDYPDKKLKLVDELVSGESYLNEYAEYWASVWTNSLIGPTGGTRRGDLASRDGLKKYLRDAIGKNKPYDQIAFELISATGSSRPGAKDFNGATNFMLAVMDDKAVLATGHTAQVFMGSQIQCARCHDHAGTEKLTQKQFWEFNSLLRQMEFQRDAQSGNLQLVNVDFVGEGDHAQDAIVYYENSAGELKAVGPAFQGESLSTNGLLAEVDRRTELASRIVETDEFARTVVNRVWTHFLTYGLSGELSGIAADAKASHPEILDELATEFAAHRYNMKDLIRWVALSDAFGLSEQDIELDAKDLPEIGDRPLFTRYYKRLTPESVPTALASAAKAHSAGGLAARVDWAHLQILGKKQDGAGNSELFVPVMPTVVSAQGRQFIHKMSGSEKLTTDQKVQHLFMAAVSRVPRANETKEIEKLSAAYKDNVTGVLDVAGMLEVIWVVLTKSNEFVLDR